MNHLTKLSLLFFVLLFLSCKKNEGTSPTTTTETPSTSLFDVEIGDSKIPYIVIDTKGEAIQNEPKIAAEMTIYEEQMEIQNTTIGIEFR